MTREEALHALKSLLEATDKLRHWHCWGRQGEGMVVSSESVRGIWEESEKAKAALAKGGGDE